MIFFKFNLFINHHVLAHAHTSLRDSLQTDKQEYFLYELLTTTNRHGKIHFYPFFFSKYFNSNLTSSLVFLMPMMHIMLYLV